MHYRLHGLDGILFSLFVICAIWMLWVPQCYLHKKYWKRPWKDIFLLDDRDNYEDTKVYLDSIKARFRKPIGKIATFYIAFYLLFVVFKFLFSS